MDLTYLFQDDPRYPDTLLSALGGRAPISITVAGSPAILDRKTLGLFCSVKCPGRLINQAYDTARILRDAGVTVIGGFHAPMEKECLNLLLRGRQPVIICPARGLEGFRPPPEWRVPLADGHLLLLSPFRARDRRMSVEFAVARNRFVAALADAILVAHAEPGGKTAQFCDEILGWQKPVYTLDDPANRHLVDRGAQPVTPQSAPEWAPR